MIATLPSMSDLIGVINEETHLNHDPIKIAINDVISDITEGVKINDKPSIKVQDSIFRLRILLLKYLMKHQEIINKLKTFIAEEILIKKYLMSENEELARTTSDCLSVYYEVFHGLTPVYMNIDKEIEEIFPESEKPSIRNYLLMLHTTHESSQLISLLLSSVNFDYSLILADLVFQKKVTISNEKVKNLEKLMKESITDYGASVATNLKIWEPDNDDERQLIRNIKIKIAKSDIENNKGKRVTLDELKSFITSN